MMAVQPKAIYLSKNHRAKRIGDFCRCDNIVCRERSGGGGTGSRGVICEPPVFYYRGLVQKVDEPNQIEVSMMLCCECRKLVDDDGKFELYFV